MRLGHLILILLIHDGLTSSIERWRAGLFGKSNRKIICPPDFHQIGRRCYAIFENRNSWLESHFFCKDKNAKLAEPHKRSQQLLQRYLQNHDKTKKESIWIGFQYDWQSHFWQTSMSGKKIEYLSYYLKPGSEETLRDHCAVFDPTQNYNWSSRICSDKLRFMCQHKLPRMSKRTRNNYRNTTTTYKFLNKQNHDYQRKYHQPYKDNNTRGNNATPKVGRTGIPDQSAISNESRLNIFERPKSAETNVISVWKHQQTNHDRQLQHKRYKEKVILREKLLRNSLDNNKAQHVRNESVTQIKINGNPKIILENQQKRPEKQFSKTEHTNPLAFDDKMLTNTKEVPRRLVEIEKPLKYEDLKNKVTLKQDYHKEFPNIQQTKDVVRQLQTIQGVEFQTKRTQEKAIINEKQNIEIEDFGKTRIKKIEKICLSEATRTKKPSKDKNHYAERIAKLPPEERRIFLENRKSRKATKQKEEQKCIKEFTENKNSSLFI